MLRRVFTGVGVNIFDKLVIAVVQLTVVPLLAHAWGLRHYGVWVMISTVPTFLAMGDLGFATAAGTKMTIAEARGERDVVIRIFQSGWGAILMSSAVFTSVAFAAAFMLPDSFLGAEPGLSIAELRLTLLLLLLYGILGVQGSIFFAGFRAAGLFALGSFWQALVIVVENVTMISVVVLGGSLTHAAAALLAGRFTGLIGQNLLLRRSVPWMAIGLRHAEWKEMRSLLAPAGAVMLLPIAQACMLQGSVLALGAAVGAAAVPQFTAARTLSRIGQQLCWTVNAALMPEVSAAIGRRDRGAITMMTFSTIAVSAILVVPFALGFVIFGRWAVWVWSNHLILPSFITILGVGLSILFSGFWFPLSNLILAADKQGSYTGIYAALALVSLPISYAVARQIGGGGVALSMAFVDGLMLMLIFRLTETHLARRHEILAAAPKAGGHFLALSRKVVARKQM